MATEIKMPQLSDTMHSGKIIGWKKKEGDQVKRGDILAEVETDKANLEIESFGQGVLLKIATPAGATANVGEVIAFIGEAGEKISASQVDTTKTNGANPHASATHSKEAESARQVAAASPPSVTSPVPPPAPSPVHQKPTLVTTQMLSQRENDRVKASPLARKIARDRNIDISLVSGTGPAGRVIRRDIDAVMAEQSQTQVDSTQQAVGNVEPLRPSVVKVPIARAPGAITGGKSTPLSKMRETIARRMQESVTQAPHFYVTAVINMSEAKKLRTILKETPGYEGISFNHLIIKAVAYALSNEPRVNRSMKDGMMFEPDNINIGIITSIDDGLMIPVLHQADTMSLKDVVFEAKASIDRARAGRPTAQDLSGGTFSISNMGMFDVDSFTAIINPGQGGILAVSAIKEEPVVVSGMVVPGLTMKATVSVDHRIIDGVMAGNFMKFLKQALEVPALLML